MMSRHLAFELSVLAGLCVLAIFPSQPWRVLTRRRTDRLPPCKPREQSSACVSAAMRASLKIVLTWGQVEALELYVIVGYSVMTNVVACYIGDQGGLTTS
jgi:hypothetical protein